MSKFESPRLTRTEVKNISMALLEAIEWNNSVIDANDKYDPRYCKSLRKENARYGVLWEKLRPFRPASKK